MKGNRLKSRDRYLEEVMLFLRYRPHQGDHGRFRSYRASKGGPPGLLGQKQKLKALSLKWVFETVPAFVPEADETRRRVIRRHLARGGAEN